MESPEGKLTVDSHFLNLSLDTKEIIVKEVPDNFLLGKIRTGATLLGAIAKSKKSPFFDFAKKNFACKFYLPYDFTRNCLPNTTHAPLKR
jgi:hypothetical protein